ncbi:DUF397 domain-containing protein [Actinomadura vinacea]|uniref:DUF397 domain-containing protein n=1 Tax=Actinomadura vinacea TaxID=115336 RepID=A0ABN3JSX5_9ACTN
MNHPSDDLTRARWRKSSHSGSGDQCVEVAALNGDRRAVRDSQDPHGPALKFSRAEWDRFLTAVRNV